MQYLKVQCSAVYRSATKKTYEEGKKEDDEEEGEEEEEGKRPIGQ